MGRLAKYKKIKSCDPYSKKNGGNVNLNQVGIWGLGDNGRKIKKRSKRAELMRTKTKRRVEGDDGFDLPPDERDEFDMKDLVGSIKKQKVENPVKEALGTTMDNTATVDRVEVNGNVATIPKTEQDERKIARMLKSDTQAKKETEKKENVQYRRMEGESKRAYAKRTKVETRQIIQKTATNVNHEKRQKKKDFLNNKKKSKKGGAFSNSNVSETWGDNVDDDTSTLITGERAVAMADEVRFGEQAERPPTFRQLPRGATKKNDKSQKANKKGMTDEEVEAEKDAMELMRRKVQAQYAVIKMKRRLAGDFHL